jgi:hypothetical protein
MKTALPLALIALMIACFPLQSYDLFWHLAAGKYIVGNGIPREDPFAAHSTGEWVNHAWAFDVAARSVEAAAGIQGLLVLRVLLVAGLGWLVHRILRARGWEAGPVWAMVFMVLALSRHRFDLRPDLLAHLWLALLFLLALKRRHAGVPLLLLAWVNTHASFLMGWGLGLFLLVLDAWRERSRRPAFAAAAALVVPLLNPWGWRAFTAPIALHAQVKTMGLVNPEWMAPTLSLFPGFFLAFAAAAVGLILGRRALRPEHAVALPLAALALSSLRFIGFFAVGLAFVLPAPGGTTGRRRALAAVLAGIGAFALGASCRTFSAPGWGLDASILPVHETAFIRRAGLEGPMFNSAGFGGYLIHALYPEHQVFWDGRNELYAPLLRELKDALPSAAAWRSFLDRYGIRWAVVRYQGEETVVGPRGRARRPWSVSHFPPEGWALVYWDDAGMVLVRREGLRLPEWTVNPESARWVGEEIRAGRLDRAAVSAELDRKMRENPGSRRAAWLRRLVLGAGQEGGISSTIPGNS